MATVKLRFSAVPAHVRTARLVAAAVARRAGVDESLLDEVRLAVGEACSRAVGLHQRSRPDEPVLVTLTHAGGRLLIEVSDRVPAQVDPTVAVFETITADTDPKPRGESGNEDLNGDRGAAHRGAATAAALGASSGESDTAGADPLRLSQMTALPTAGARVPAPFAGSEAGAESDYLAEESDALSGAMGLAVISGLVDDLEVRTGSDGVVIRMSWPAQAEQEVRAAPH